MEYIGKSYTFLVYEITNYELEQAQLQQTVINRRVEMIAEYLQLIIEIV